MFTPLRDIVLISKIAAEKVTKSGLILTGAPIEASTRAVVEEVGPGFIAQQSGEFIPTTVKKGDLVIVPAECGRQVKIPGYGDKELYIVLEAEIAGIITEE